ncbi:MAG TPA: YdcF family protein [Pyrinomonadaceae bacterium]|nr:YdcF family protein [Pyrinomonadaceae bacterium]
MHGAEVPSNNRKWNWRRVVRWLPVLIVFWFVLAWVGARALIVQQDLPTADAIVILSGSSTYVERTQKAAELYRQGRAPLIVLTDDNTRGGWSNALQRNPYFVERAHDELTKQGVPPDKIRVAPGIAASTRDEALIIRDYALAQRLKSILIVTSAYHSRRALRILRLTFAGGETSLGIAPAPTGAQTPSPVLWWLYLEGWRSVAGEYVKLIYYWLKYG